MELIKSYYIIPLYNVDPTEMDPKILPDGYKLISNQEFFLNYRSALTNYLGDLAEDIKIVHPGEICRRVTATYLLVKELPVHPLITLRINDELYKKEQEAIIEWIFALRLLNSGNIQVNQSYSVSQSFYSSYCLTIGTMVDNLDNVWNFALDERCALENYPLGKVNPNELSKMIAKCSKHYPVMKIPLNYWNLYYQERELINKIIKLATVWEVTLLNDKKNELQYALKMRGSCVLGKDARKIFELAYSVRSELLHTGRVESKTINRINEHMGTNYKYEWTTLFYFMRNILEPMTRSILIYFLDNIDQTHLNLKQIAQQIDDRICTFIKLGHLTSTIK